MAKIQKLPRKLSFEEFITRKFCNETPTLIPILRFSNLLQSYEIRGIITFKSAYLGKRNNITTYSIYISPLAFFDVHFMIAAACNIVVVAIIEKRLAKYGIIGGAAALSGLLRIALPIVAFGSMIYLISRLGIYIKFMLR